MLSKQSGRRPDRVTALKKASGRWSVWFVAALFGATALHFASFKAFWSPDCGARFAMIRSLLEHGSLIHWNYAAGAADPVGQIHPIAFFLLHRANDIVPQYEPLFPLLSAVPYKLFGFYGLAIILYRIAVIGFDFFAKHLPYGDGRTSKSKPKNINCPMSSKSLTFPRGGEYRLSIDAIY